MIKLNDQRLNWMVRMQNPHEVQPPEKLITRTSKAKIKKWKDRLKTVGFVLPILIDKSNVAITGVARLLAARELGMTEIPTLCHSDLTPEHLRAIRIADNFGLGGMDVDYVLLAEELKEIEKAGFNLLDIGFETAELDKIFAAAIVGLSGETEDLTPPLMPVPKKGDFFLLGEHRLGCDDARDPDVLLKLMAGVSAAAVIMDPPFNLPIAGHVSGLGKNKHREFAMASGEMSEEQFEQFNKDYLKAALPYLKAGGHAYVSWTGAAPSRSPRLRRNFPSTTSTPVCR